MVSKKIIVLLFSIYSFSLLAQNSNIELIRKEYGNVRLDSSSCAALYAKIKNTTSTDILSNSYKGAIMASMASYTKNKQEKINLFNQGKKIMEESIAKDTSSIEARFLRLTVQTSCPKVLGYHKHIEQDKAYVLANYNSIKDKTLKQMIAAFLIDSKYVTDKEKSNLKNNL
ncbi:MAG: hypothetical protein JNL69_04940 [Bacteroidia bacterium]|nr:hypothetical protein [Bacteroidia bacterium]